MVVTTTIISTSIYKGISIGHNNLFYIFKHEFNSKSQRINKMNSLMEIHAVGSANV